MRWPLRVYHGGVLRRCSHAGWPRLRELMRGVVEEDAERVRYPNPLTFLPSHPAAVQPTIESFSVGTMMQICKVVHLINGTEPLPTFGGGRFAANEEGAAQRRHRRGNCWHSFECLSGRLGRPRHASCPDSASTRLRTSSVAAGSRVDRYNLAWSSHPNSATYARTER